MKRCERPQDPRFAAWAMLLETQGVLLEILAKELDEEAGGLPITWYDVLVQLAMSPADRLTMKELASSVLLSKSGITRLVDRMTAAGMIERQACPQDGRVVYARLTAKGRAVFEDAAPVHIAGVERHFSDLLSDEEAAAIGSGFSKVLDAARAMRTQEQRVIA